MNRSTTVVLASALTLALAFSSRAAHAQTENTFTGTSAGIHSTGDFNSGFGFQSLFSNTSGEENTAVGWDSLIFNTTGVGNVAVGENVMRDNATGTDNVAIGHGAMLHNDVDGNVGIGAAALSANGVGIQNVAVGYEAGSSLNDVGANTLVGYQALASAAGHNTGFNVAIGTTALGQATTAFQTVAIGFQAMEASTTATNSVAIGNTALTFCTNCDSDVAVGGQSLNRATGIRNTALGTLSGVAIQTGQDNVAIGWNTLFNVVAGSDNTAVGFNSGPSADFSSTVALGAAAEPQMNGDVALGNFAVSRIGGFKPYSNLSDARFKTNVKENVPGLAFIKRLRPVTYNWDMDKLAVLDGQKQSVSAVNEALRKQNAEELNTGFLAQEVEQAAKDIGYQFSGVSKPTNDTAPYALAYSEFVVPLVKAVQEQQAQIDQLRESLKVARLERTEPAQHSGMLGDTSSLGVVGGLLGLLFIKRSKENSTGAQK